MYASGRASDASVEHPATREKVAQLQSTIVGVGVGIGVAVAIAIGGHFDTHPDCDPDTDSDAGLLWSQLYFWSSTD